MAALGAAITDVSSARKAVVRAVGAVQAGASALDATDAICAQGRGVAARASRRSGSGDVARAAAAVRDLPGLARRESAALTALTEASGVVSGAQRAALDAVVRDGRAEVAAVTSFSGVVRSAWQQYASLDGQQQLWIERAVTPWYRTDKEGADAYAVLVGPFRPLLNVARHQTEAASKAVRGPIATEAATLARADDALAGLRGTPTPTLAG